MNLFSARLNWLYAALGLNDPRIPTHLDVDRLVASADVLQGGWALAQWTRGTVDRAASTAATSPDLVTADAAKVRLLIGASVVRVGGGGATSVLLYYIDPLTGMSIRLSSPAIAVGGTIFWHDFRSGGLPLVVPPGMSLRIDLGATAAGETFAARWLYAEMPVGFKPI